MADSDKEEFRARFAELVSELLRETREVDDPVSAAIQEHLGSSGTGLPVYGERLPSFELANLQLGLDAALGRPGFSCRLLGIAGQGRHFSDVSLGDLLAGSNFRLGPPEYGSAPSGPGKTLSCLVWAILLVTGPDGPICVFVRRGQDNGPSPGITLQAMSPSDGLAAAFLADVRQLMVEHDVFRGQVITIEADRRGGRQVVFLERPELAADDLVLPDGVLERIEQHVLGTTRHRDELLALGRHLSRGLLLWGPPGTGKTHSVRYLTGQLAGTTVVILSGPSVGLIGTFANLGRRLAPAVVVLEDVDLIATERSTFADGPRGGLFELMNEMSGLAVDADVAFVLTTNRPDVLEPALAARPGRVDLAIEIPLPDAKARGRLLEVYSRGLDLDTTDLDDVIARTEGTTASFIKELLRKATLTALESGRDTVSKDDLTQALDELLDDTASLTRVLLGNRKDDASPTAPDAWMRKVALHEPRVRRP